MISENFIVSKQQLVNAFHDGCKPESEFKIGIELEKLPVNSQNIAVSYYGKNGIQEFLSRYKTNFNWEGVYEKDYLIGLKKEKAYITLEPGAQVECSTEPFSTIHDVDFYIKKYNSETAKIGKKLGIKWIGAGLQPLSTYDKVKVIPKKRYEIMGKYLPEKGSQSLVMMKETAGIQASFDFSSEEDAINKLRISVLMSPFISAIFSNSPLRNGVNTGYKSYRSYSWLNTDNSRCGLISPKLLNKDFNFTFSDYVDILLDMPMIFIQKDDKTIDSLNMTFRQYLSNGYNGYSATIADWELHSNLFFPVVRLKNFIENRYCDCQRADLMSAFPALLKGILYDNAAMSAVYNLLGDINWEELNEIRTNVPKYALNTSVKNKKVLDYSKEIVNIAKTTLNSINNKNYNGETEAMYLDKVVELLNKGLTPADEVIQIWNEHKNLNKLIEYLQIQ